MLPKRELERAWKKGEEKKRGNGFVRHIYIFHPKKTSAPSSQKASIMRN